ncbi:MAG: NUDIX domain-containing protein [Reichenbachiella sp.]
MLADELIQNFGNKIRVRVMGLLIKDEKLLVINHSGLNDKNTFWSPPGGGLEFGTNMKINLHREFQEETHLNVKVGDFLFGNEFFNNDFHAIELFFKVDKIGGKMKLGKDPEMKGEEILKNLKFMTLEEIRANGKDCYHSVFDKVNTFDELFLQKETFYFQNNP